jgi:hypothetical protein
MPDPSAIEANAFIDSMPLTSIWIHAARDQEPNGLPVH